MRGFHAVSTPSAIPSCSIASSHPFPLQVVVMEAAVLLEASWNDVVDEVWVCIIPSTEAVQRVVDRNALTPEAAQKRIDAQLSNVERVAKADVVLSTLWEPEVTQKQCEKAWKLLIERM